MPADYKTKTHNWFKHLMFGFSPKWLALILAALFLVLSLPLGFFFAKTFSHEYKVNQKIVLADQVIINDLLFFKLTDICPTEIKDDKTGDIKKQCLEPLPIGEVSIRFYAVCILLGVLAGYAMALYLAGLNYVNGNVIDRLIVGLIVFSLIGARLFFVAFNLDKYWDKPYAILTEMGQGGLAIFGALIASILYIALYCRRYKFNFFEFLDFLAPSVLVGQIIGRFGNFFNYEGYGPETSVFWKMFVPDSAGFYGEIGAKYFHPTFLYEIIPNCLLLIYLLYTYTDSTRKNSGFVFAKYAMGYGFIRFAAEFFRLDSLKIRLPTFLQFDILKIFRLEFIMVSQIGALFLFLVGYTIWKKRQKVIYIKKDMTELFI
jgi:phosphatidylglycerol---prolipoprotein diacylglyceryl transferase